MPWWVMIFANGTILYIGAGLACVGLVVRCNAKKRIWMFAGNVLALLGAIGAGLSAAPLPWWLYAVWGALCAAALTGVNWTGAARKWPVAGLILVIGASMAACGIEAWHGKLPRLAVPSGALALYVVGDSLSIGADEPEWNWPELLGARLKLPAHNHSFGGAKAGTAISNAKRVGPEPALVLLEIGGNDLFAGTPPQQFAQDLRALLETVRGPGHTLLMLELPLPPTFNRYGQIQRELAKEFGATLIPKRILGGAFSVPDATLDGLHFSHAGHAALAARISGLFEE